LLGLAGRTALVRHVLSAIPVYILMAMSVPKWVIKSIDKLMRRFLWKGRKNVNGGSCLVPWEIVTRPLKYGGLGAGMAMGAYPSGSTIPYSYPSKKILPIELPIYTRGYKILPIPVPARKELNSNIPITQNIK
jgi:hypothetical protein